MSLFRELIYSTSLISLSGAMFAGPVTSAELYKWVDENGVTQYSQSPPVGKAEVQTMNVKVTPADPAAAETLKARVESLDKIRDTRAEDQQLNRQVEEAKAVNEENCRRARARLAAYSVPNALIEQVDGSRARVDEATRQKELTASQEMVKTYCN